MKSTAWMASLLVLINTGCSGDSSLRKGVVEVPGMAREWEAPFTRTSGWTGADGAATIPLPNNQTLWLFGDTWVGPVIDRRHAAGSTMVNNTIAVCPMQSRAPTPDQFRFYWGDDNGKPVAWSVPTQSDQWFWPAGGGVICRAPDGGDCLLLFMARISRIDTSDSIWNFRARGTTLLTVSNPAEEPARWLSTQHTVSDLTPGNPQVIWGAATWLSTDQTLYIYGIDGTDSHNKKLLLAKAPATEAGDSHTWKFRGLAGWSDRASDAVPVAQNLSSELSLDRIPVAGSLRFVMVYSEPPLGSGIMLRTAEAAEGPWSEPMRIYNCPEPAVDAKLFAYSAKAHPELSKPGQLLISYCVNSTDFWDVAAHADKYRPRFIVVPNSAMLGTR